MALTQEEVDNFLAAGKTVSGRLMTWRVAGKDQARWTVPVELDAENRGTLDLFTGRSTPRDWKFKLSLGNTEVLQWHFVPQDRPVRHKNTGCPSRFPSSVQACVHEHLWTPERGCACAHPLSRDLQKLTDHKSALERFCDRAKIEFQIVYSTPLSAQEQLGLET